MAEAKGGCIMQNAKISTKTIAYTAMMTAIVYVTTLLGISVGTGYVNMGDTMIFVTAYLFGPVPALIAGGIGSFFADLTVYPLTMWFTLFIKGFEGLVAGLFIRFVAEKVDSKDIRHKVLAGVGMLLGAIVMVGGYFGTQALIWGGDAENNLSRLATATAQLPWDCLQAGVSMVLANVLLYGLRLRDLVRNKRRPEPAKDQADSADLTTDQKA